ncbi:hypothetical protein F5Y12DRAFT_798579 [Xylaria sp. FL1777]|nr:hypothetical protein F5Y12DRAFT_798579 [Xylaria sp. FL1777]
MSWNTTTAIPTPTGDIDTYKKKPGEHHQIPVTSTKCMGHNLTDQRVNYFHAKWKLIEWQDKPGHWVPPGLYHYESAPDNYTGVTWYICNCKYFYPDKAPAWELDQVQQILDDQCGQFQSGWVWSKKWEKGYNVVPTEWFKPRLRIQRKKPICPRGCFFW